MTNRILLASCNPDDPALELPVFSALKKLGHEVETCDAKYKPFGSRLLFRIGRKLFKYRAPYIWNNVVLAVSSWFVQKKVLRAAKKFKPDIFLAIKAKEIEPETIKKLNNMGIITANWYMEGLWHQSVFILAPVYKYFFVMDKHAVSVLREKGIESAYYMPHGTRIVSERANSLEDQARIYDVAFIGTPNPLREEVLLSLSGVNINIWGPSEWGKTKLRDFYRGKVFGLDLDNIYRKSKIVINSHNSTDNTSGTNLRDFESVSNGALLVSDYNDGLGEIFTENKDIIFYRSINELPKLISYYLEKEGERETIAKSGQRIVFSKHTIENRVGDILGTIKNKPII